MHMPAEFSLDCFVSDHRVSVYCTFLKGTITPQTKGSVGSGAANKFKPELCTC